MLQLELRRNTIYLTTDNKADILRAIQFLTREHEQMEELGTMQRTIYVTKPIKEVEVKP